jgi:uncharacterized RDD family membrane protein YckC
MTMNQIFCNHCGSPSAGDASFCQNCGARMAVAAAPIAQGLAPQTLPRYAGFWIRVLSAMIDGTLLIFAHWPIRVLLNSAMTLIAMDFHIAALEMPGRQRLIRIGIGLVISWAYRAGMESSSTQGTLGKMALGLKVTDEMGNRIDLARATARHFSKYLSLFTLCIGYVMAGFDARKQALHDRIAGTLVVYRDRSY